MLKKYYAREDEAESESKKENLKVEANTDGLLEKETPSNHTRGITVRTWHVPAKKCE